MSSPCPQAWRASTGYPRAYAFALAILIAVWLIGMTAAGGWGWFREHWAMSVTMIFGSFVAGSTPAGGASVAFPVFTKALAIESTDAATFGLFIQAIGMSMASLYIVTKRIPIYLHLYKRAAFGGVTGVVIGVCFLSIPAPFPKLLFSCLVLTFGLTLALIRLNRRQEARNLSSITWKPGDRAGLFLISVAGGLLASQIGSGADMLVFMVMTIAFRLDEKCAVPTSVLIMATVSIAGVGAILLTPQRSIGLVWHYWAVCVPIVAVGAPLGAYVISRVPTGVVLAALFLLIVLEVTSTFLIVPMTTPRFGFVAVALLVASLCQLGLYRYGEKRRCPTD